MRASWSDWMPVFGVEEDCILSKAGDYTVAYRIRKPELFTLSGADYEGLHRTFVKAIRVLPPYSVLHLQDWYTKVSYQPDFSGEEKSWLGQASERFFNERAWLDHEAYLFLTKRVGNWWSNSAISQLIRPYIIPRETLDKRAAESFLAKCGQFVQILSDSGLVHLERLGKTKLWSLDKNAGLIEQYCSLEKTGRPVLKDIAFEQGVQIGDLHTQLFTLSDTQDLPNHCGPRIDYEPYSTERTAFSVGFASMLGPLLPCNHIYNQFVFIGDGPATLKQLETKKLRLLSLSAYSRENSATLDSVEQYLDEAVSNGRMPVKAHFNVFAWTDRKDEFQDIRNQISSALSKMGVSPRLETVGAPSIWFSAIPGNEGDFPMNEAFDTFPEQAACFFQYESNYRDSLSPFGIRLGDRVSGRPIHVDIDDEPKAKGIIANGNMIAIAGTGSGKSFCMNHIVREYYEQGTHIVIIDVGHSYELQCQYHKGYYFTYEPDRPIQFNPFWLGAGEIMDTEKKESIKTMLLALWKKSDESHNRSEYVALSTALKLYFEKLAQDKAIVPGFNSFYEFLSEEFVETLARDQVKEKDFDMSNFLYVLRPYYRGGEFDYLLNATENLDLLDERFIVFELDNIKNHPILFPVVTLIIMELFVSKMRKLEGIRKMLVIEEAWKAIAQEGMAEYIKYCFKTVRKFYGKAVVVTQEIEDIISSEVVKQAIINNADIKLLLDQSKFQNKFGQLQELLGITDKQKAEILSINRGREPGRLYKDLWIGLGAFHSKVYRLEVSKEEYCIYTSEQKEKKIIKEYIKRFGDVRAGIRAFLQQAGERGGKLFVMAMLILAPTFLKAQDIPIIGPVISKVIKALDLQVQRIQTQTIWLEEAQKVIENTMSQLDLADIRDWVQAQKDLYASYFRELWQVKTAINYYYRITELVHRQEQIVSSCRQSLNLFGHDKNFSSDEVTHMAAVYSGIIKESLSNLDQLLMVTKSFTTQMSDEARLAIINRTADNMDRNYSELSRFNNQNALLSRLRSSSEGDIELLRKLYGL